VRGHILTYVSGATTITTTLLSLYGAAFKLQVGTTPLQENGELLQLNLFTHFIAVKGVQIVIDDARMKKILCRRYPKRVI